MQMQISFNQKGMTVAIGERTVLLGRRTRMALAVAFTVLVHILILWSLSAYHARDMDIGMTYDSPVDTTLYRPEPIPEPIPPLPTHQLRQEPITESAPVPVEPAPSLQPSPQPQPQTQQAQTEPTPTPSPQFKVAPREVDNVQAVNTPVAKSIPQPQPTVQNTPTNVPTVADEPAPVPMKVKKKEEEDQALDAKRQIAVQAPSELNLHETTVPNVTVSPVAPSGLTPNPSSRMAAAGGAPSTGAAGASGGQGAAGLKGRGSATQALQNHENCITRQTDGKPIPPDCHMKDFASMQSSGPRPDSDFQAAVARRDARLKYKTDPGNADYWQRVGHNPSAYHQTDDHPTPGQYSSARDQRVMTGNVNSNIGH